MQRSIFWRMLFLPILAISMSCEDVDDDLGDSFGDESLEDRAVSVVATYQAENRTAASGCQVASNHTGFTGSGFIDFGGNGTWIEWNNVTVSNQAKYNLTFRYAVGTYTRQSAVFVNGQNVGNVGFANTGSWTNWKTDSIQAQLRQGINTIRIMANTGSGGPNLDKMEISIDDLCPNDPNKTEPGECGCGVPEGSCDSIDRLLYEEKFDSLGGSFRCTKNTCSWTSKTIDVSGSTKLLISADTRCFEVGQFESADYIRISYSIDGGAFVTFFENTDDLKTQNVSESISNSGRSMRIKIDAKTSANNETYVVDNLTVKGNGGNTDNCPDDPNKTEPGLCGCGVPEGTCDKCTNTLLAHGKLLPGEHICSENGKYEFGLSSGGELAVGTDSKTLWSAGTFGSNVHLIMQGDGNLVVYNSTIALWDTKTHGNSGATLKLENDGRVVIRLGSRELWSQGGDNSTTSISTIEDLDKASVFSFAAFSDNRGEVDENSGKAFKWIQNANHKFVVAVGDVFDGNSSDDKTLDMWKNNSFYHNNLYPTFGNHCSRIMIDGKQGSQTNWGRPAFSLDYLNLRGRPDVEFRKPTSDPIWGYKTKDDHSLKAYDDQYIDYYVKLTYGKFRVHIVSVYKGDHTPFAWRSAKFLFDKVVELSETKTDYDIIILSSHEERWLWRAYKEGFNGGPPPLTESQVKYIVSTVDLVLAASDHRFRRLCETEHYWGDIQNQALQVDTGQVYNTSSKDGYVEFHVFDNPPRFTAQYIDCSRSSRQLQVGEATSSIIDSRDCEHKAGKTLLKPMMKKVNGPITQPVDWDKF